MSERRRTRETPLRAGQERLELQLNERTGRERGVREEDVPIGPAYLDGGNLRDTGLLRGRDYIPDGAPPIRRMMAGGPVRGDGCCMRGHTKGRMR